MKKKIKALREQLGTVNERMTSTRNLVKAENRDMTEDETVQFDKDLDEAERLVGEVDKLERQVKIEADAARLAGSPVADSTSKEEAEKKRIADQFSFGRAISAAFGGKVDGVEREMMEEAEREMNNCGINVSKDAIVIPQMVLNRAAITENGTSGVEAMSFVDAVYADTILGDLGVTRLQTAQDKRIPIIGSVTTQWEGETDNAADGGSAMSKKDLTPHRLASFLDYSKQAALQHNPSLEQALRRALSESAAAKLEYSVLTDDTTSGGPAHIGAGKTAKTASSANALMLAVVEEVLGNNHNKGSLGFAISHELFNAVHTAAKVSGVSALLQDGKIMDMIAKFSTQIADVNTDKPAVYYGNWSKVQIGQFGGIEILVDPYTQAVAGKNRLVLNSYWDHVLTQADAISVGGLV